MSNRLQCASRAPNLDGSRTSSCEYTRATVCLCVSVYLCRGVSVRPFPCESYSTTRHATPKEEFKIKLNNGVWFNDVGLLFLAHQFWVKMSRGFGFNNFALLFLLVYQYRMKLSYGFRFINSGLRFLVHQTHSKN